MDSDFAPMIIGVSLIMLTTQCVVFVMGQVGRYKLARSEEAGYSNRSVSGLDPLYPDVNSPFFVGA
jgi:hypothetical protein